MLVLLKKYTIPQFALNTNCFTFCDNLLHKVSLCYFLTYSSSVKLTQKFMWTVQDMKCVGKNKFSNAVAIADDIQRDENSLFRKGGLAESTECSLSNNGLRWGVAFRWKRERDIYIGIETSILRCALKSSPSSLMQPPVVFLFFIVWARFYAGISYISPALLK